VTANTPTDMLHWIPEPLTHAFMQRAFIGMALCAIACAFIGSHLVVRRMTFVGSALTHTLLPGVVAAWLLGISTYIGAGVAGLLTAGLVVLVGRRRESGEDAAIGVVQSALFALGIILMAQAQSWRDFTGLLFGSVLGIDDAELVLMASLCLLVVGVLIVIHKELEASALDDDYASMAGARPIILRLLLVALAGIAAASAVRLVGAMLTTAFLIVPAAGGVLLARSLSQVIFWSVSLSLIGGTSGLFVSYYYESIPAGAGMVMGCCLAFVLARLWRSWRG
jgi:manganese/iron transport system permease protein